MTTQELNEFWEARKVKIWVVTLDNGHSKNPKKDTKIVRASTRQKALITAKRNSLTFSGKKCFGTARYAHPVSDLHCVQVNV